MKRLLMQVIVILSVIIMIVAGAVISIGKTQNNMVYILIGSILFVLGLLHILAMSIYNKFLNT